MNLEWILTGIILMGAMIAGGISLWFKRRREKTDQSLNGLDDFRV